MKRYRNLSKLLSTTLAIGFLPGVLRAAEPESTDKAPARQIKFVLEDEPLEIDQQGQSGYAELPEGTFYAALVRGYAPLLVGTHRHGPAMAADPAALRMLTEGRSTTTARRLGSFMDTFLSSVDQQFRFRSRVIEEAVTPNDRPPLKHVVLNGHLTQFLSMSNLINSPETASIQWNVVTLADLGTRTPLQEYDFVAGTIEDAKRIAQDFLAVHDDIFVRHLIVATKKAKADLTAARADIEPKLAEANEQYAAEELELKQVEPLSDTAVSDLKVKRTLLKVELAGIKARVKTISEKLVELKEEHLSQGKPLQTRRRDQLVDLKVTADIDMASLAAQQEVLDELLDGQRRLTRLHSKSSPELRNLKGKMEHIERNLPICDALLADLNPFQLLNDTIVIRPVKFVVPGDEAAGQ